MEKPQGDDPSTPRPDNSGAPGQPFRRPRVPVEPPPETTRRQYVLAGLIAAFTAASLLGWAVSDPGLSDTGLYFIGIPGLTAAIIAALPMGSGGGRPKAMRMTLIVLLASAIVLREGVICIAMASPLIFLVVFLASHPPDKSARTMVVLLPLLLLGSAEGVVFDLSANAVAIEQRRITAAPSDIEQALATASEVPAIEPLLFKLPFPKPTAFVNEGVELGQVQHMWFGDLVMRTVVADRTDHSARWVVVEDTTPISDWYRIESIDMTWLPVAGADGSANAVELTVEIAYERKLAPAIYFDPLGRWGLSSLADVMADMVETGVAQGTQASDSVVAAA